MLFHILGQKYFVLKTKFLVQCGIVGHIDPAIESENLVINFLPLLSYIAPFQGVYLLFSESVPPLQIQ
ncbi:hypothetical protein VTO42DRAFT_3941 [Malbranchea cinnamomea]